MNFEVRSFAHIIPKSSNEIDDTHFEVCRHCSVSGGSRLAGAALPPCATVATKTPAATAMAGALPTINNQLKAAVAMAMEMMTTTTHKT
jgi:hypothetical protein